MPGEFESEQSGDTTN